MAIAYPTGIQPPVATADATVTQTTHSAPPTGTPAMTAIIAANCLDRGKPQRPASPSFTMNTIVESHPGTPANPLLTVNMGNKGNANAFITPTMATNCLNCQEN